MSSSDVWIPKIPLCLSNQRRVALVTGGNAGLGYTAVVELAQRSSPARSFLLLETNGVNFSRTPYTAGAVIAARKAGVPSAQVAFLAFDLTSLRATKAAADVFLEKEAHGYTGFERGVMADGEFSADEIELQACNGTGHFALVLPLLRHRIFAKHARPHRHPLERGAPRRTEPKFSDLKS
ncbi:hypothetical protein B0H14DRAFT_3884341 [Mycena olivaceomarginata]|nr:hypothetical protein B0H14DRAFT_3884341 [Mycena olivaceomarginata]